MQQLRGVQSAKTLGELSEDVPQTIDIAPRSVRPHVPEEIAALDELHRQQPARAFRHELEQLHQVRVAHVHQCPELPFEPEQNLRIVAVQELERDGDLLIPIPRLVDRAERTRPELALDDESRRSLERRKVRDQLGLWSLVGSSRGSILSYYPAQ